MILQNAEVGTQYLVKSSSFKKPTPLSPVYLTVMHLNKTHVHLCVHMHIYSYSSINGFKAVTDFNIVLNPGFEYFHAESVLH